jgi:hypothetical protein
MVKYDIEIFAGGRKDFLRGIILSKSAIINRTAQNLKYGMGEIGTVFVGCGFGLFKFW